MSKVAIDVPASGHRTRLVVKAFKDKDGNIEPCKDDSFLRELSNKYPYDERHNHIN